MSGQAPDREALARRLGEVLDEWRRTCRTMGMPFRGYDAALFLMESGEVAEVVREAEQRGRDENAAIVGAMRRALDDELANLADDGARLSHSVVRRFEGILARHAGADQ